MIDILAPRYHFTLAVCRASPYIACMNSKQTKALEAVFQTPVLANIAWADIESLLVAVGCDVIEGPGSAVSFKKGDEVEFFHRPHPAKEAKRYQVRVAKDFLTRIGVEP